MEMTEQQLLQVLEEYHKGEDVEGTFSTRDLARLASCGQNKARRILRDMIEDGRVEVVTVQRETIIGTRRPVKAYRLKT